MPFEGKAVKIKVRSSTSRSEPERVIVTSSSSSTFTICEEALGLSLTELTVKITLAVLLTLLPGSVTVNLTLSVPAKLSFGI